MRMNKGMPFMDVEADFDNAPTFSWDVLYERLGKGDARFMMGVAEEYEHVIKALGPKAVKAILEVKPKLVQRLEVGNLVAKSLEDARDDTDLWREEQHPSQVLLDRDAAYSLWQELHDSYQSYYDPEKSMDRDKLRAYNWLTDALGEWEQKQRKEEQDKLPEKLKKQKKRAKQIEERKVVRKKFREANDALMNATNAKQRKEAVELFQTVKEQAEKSGLYINVQ